MIKLSIFADVWNLLTKRHIEILAEGRFVSDLPIAYREICLQGLSELDWKSARSGLAQYVQAHPIDTHPPMAQRIEALGINISGVPETVARPTDASAIELVANAEEVEQQLTALEIQWLAAVGAVSIPKPHETSISAAASGISR